MHDKLLEDSHIVPHMTFVSIAHSGQVKVAHKWPIVLSNTASNVHAMKTELMSSQEI